MREAEGERVERIDRRIGLQRRRRLGTLAVEPPQDRVGQPARADPVPLFGQLDGLRDGRVCGHATHLEQLIGAKPEEIRDIGIESCEPTAHAGEEQRIDPRATAEHPVHELLGPATVSRVEPSGTPVERGIEQLAAPQVRQHIRSRDA